jgi:IS30 family transposase
MPRYMERSTIDYLKQKGWTSVQIAEFIGHHRDTIARVLREDVEKKPGSSCAASSPTCAA